MNPDLIQKLLEAFAPSDDGPAPPPQAVQQAYNPAGYSFTEQSPAFPVEDDYLPESLQGRGSSSGRMIRIPDQPPPAPPQGDGGGDPQEQGGDVARQQEEADQILRDLREEQAKQLALDFLNKIEIVNPSKGAPDVDDLAAFLEPLDSTGPEEGAKASKHMQEEGGGRSNVGGSIWSAGRAEELLRSRGEGFKSLDDFPDADVRDRILQEARKQLGIPVEEGDIHVTGGR